MNIIDGSNVLFMNKSRIRIVIIVLIMLCTIFSAFSFADTSIDIPDINITINSEDGGVKLADSIQILVIITLLSLLPSILIMMTTFTRFIIVLGFIRRALSLQTTPPNQTLIGLAIFMTLFVMAPVFSNIYDNAYKPLSEGTITAEVAYERAEEPMKDFMLRQVRSKDLALFLNLAGTPTVENPSDIPMRALIPAFILSELKLAFEIGFLIFLPFIVIDMIVASTLMALGMMMLPPVMISLPIKVLLFIMLDGWNLIIEKLVLTVR